MDWPSIGRQSELWCTLRFCCKYVKVWEFVSQMKWSVAVMSWLKASRYLCTSDPSEQAVLNWIF